MSHPIDPAESQGFSAAHRAAIERVSELVVSFCTLPWYRVVPERCVIRGFHGAPAAAAPVRQGFVGEKWAQQLEAVILAASGLPAVPRVFDGPVIEFEIPPDRFAVVVAAVRLEFGDGNIDAWL